MSVKVGGRGTGSVKSDPLDDQGGIDQCTQTSGKCEATYPLLNFPLRFTVGLTGKADPGFEFVGWSGADGVDCPPPSLGSDPDTCSLLLEQKPLEVQADFEPLGHLVGLAGSGGGSLAGAYGLLVSGTGFAVLDPALNLSTPGLQDSSQMIGTAVAFDPLSNWLYLQEQRLDGVYLIAVDASGFAYDVSIGPLPVPFKLFAYDSKSRSLYGLAGAGGGEMSANYNLTVSGSGFYKFDLMTGEETQIAANTEQFIATAYAPDYVGSKLYLEERKMDGVHLVTIDPAGSYSDLGVLNSPFWIFGFDDRTQSLFGLNGSPSGQLSAEGLEFAGTGFSKFDLTTSTMTSLGSNTNRFMGTGFFFDRYNRTLYLQEKLNGAFHLARLRYDGSLVEAAPAMAVPLKMFGVMRGN